MSITPTPDKKAPKKNKTISRAFLEGVVERLHPALTMLEALGYTGGAVHNDLHNAIEDLKYTLNPKYNPRYME